MNKTHRNATLTTVRESVFDLMRSCGMTTVFGNPGSTELPMFRGWPSDFRYVLGLHESIAVAMADGYAQATGKAALVSLHSSAGLGHALGNLFTAYRNRAPLVVTAGQQVRAMLPFDPFLGAESPTEFPKPFVKWAVEPARPEDAPAAIARAYRLAMQAPRGPVFVSIPADDWDAETIPIAAPPVPTAPHPDAAALSAVAEALAASIAPAFVVGPEIDEAKAWKTVVALAERFAALVFVSPRSHRASFPESHALFAGFLPPSRRGVAERLDGHDVVLVLGAPAFTYHMASDGPFLPPGARLFQITCDPHVAARTPEGVAIVGDVGAGLAELLTFAPAAQRAQPSTRRPRRVRPGAGTPIPVDFLMRTLSRVRPKNSVIVEEAPSSRPAMQAQLPIDTPASFFTTASGGLGYGLPAAVGIALANPKRRTIAIIGDGSSLYAIQALWTAVQFRAPLSVVIVNNGGYEALRTFGDLFGIAPVGVDIPGIDFIALARGQGCDAVRVEQPDQLEPALREALAHNGPMLADVLVAPSGGL